MKRWIGVGLLILTLIGCGGSGDREPFEPLEEPEFDLTGRWLTTEISCISFSSDIPPFELANLDRQLEYETLQSPGTRIVQMGNDLAFTDLETGDQGDGTISGDQVHYSDSDQRDLGGLDFDAYLEAEGTVLEEGLIAGAYEMEWTFKVDGTTITGGTECTVRLRRADRKEPDSATPGDVDRQTPLVGTVVVNEAGLAIDHWGDDVYELGAGSNAPRIEEDVLTVTVSYSGGCARHDFTLVADSRFQESDPVRLDVHLAHEGNGDSCEAYPTGTYEFDLTPVKRLYQDAYGGNEGIMVLRLMGPPPFRTSPDNGYSIDLTYTFE